MSSEPEPPDAAGADDPGVNGDESLEEVFAALMRAELAWEVDAAIGAPAATAREESGDVDEGPGPFQCGLCRPRDRIDRGGRPAAARRGDPLDVGHPAVAGP